MKVTDWWRRSERWFWAFYVIFYWVWVSPNSLILRKRKKAGRVFFFNLKSLWKWNIFFPKYSLREAQLEFVWKSSLQEMTWVLTSSIKKWDGAVVRPGEPIHSAHISSWWRLDSWYRLKSVCKMELVLFPLSPVPPPELPIFVNGITILLTTQPQNLLVIFAPLSLSFPCTPTTCL